MTSEQVLRLMVELGLSAPTEHVLELLQHAPWPILVTLYGGHAAVRIWERLSEPNSGMIGRPVVGEAIRVAPEMGRNDCRDRGDRHDSESVQRQHA